MGHRLAAHTADVRVEAWAATREECLAEVVRGMVASFVEAPDEPASSHQPRDLHLDGDTDEALLVSLLDEVIYLLDTTGQVPVEVTVAPSASGVAVALGMADVRSLTQVGAVPKAVSWHGLHLGHDETGWSCSVTLDV
jgi:SHS2 domain-containing protein